MLDELAAPLRAADWPTALTLTLDAWRETRAPELAALIDTIATKLPQTGPRTVGEVHGWWMQRAVPYDPLSTDALVGCADAGLAYSDRNRVPEVPHGQPGARELTAAIQLIAARDTIEHANALERLAAMLAWPDDPRAALILGEWLVSTPVRWNAGRATLHFYGAIADRLKVLGDVRLLGRLADCELAPRGPTAQLRQQQQILARQVREALAKIKKPPKTIAKQIAALAALIPSTTAMPIRERDVDENALWADCAKHREDRARRIVLADFLAERGDSRGELIALQLAASKQAAAQARKLLRARWNTWLGDLALVLNKSGTEFVGGMLEIARVGTPHSPAWAFAKVHGHRELATVHTVRPGHVDPKHYAQLLASPNLVPHTVGFDAPEMIDELLRIRAPWPFRVVEYDQQAIRSPYRDRFPPLPITFTRLAALVPDLEELHIGSMTWIRSLDAAAPWRPGIHAALRELIPTLPAQFPRLRAIRLDPSWIADDASLATLPLVTAG